MPISTIGTVAPYLRNTSLMRGLWLMSRFRFGHPLFVEIGVGVAA